MSWTLIAQILILTMVGGLTVSGIATDIIKTHAKTKLELAKMTLEVVKAHAEAQRPTKRMPWDER